MAKITAVGLTTLAASLLLSSCAASVPYIGEESAIINQSTSVQPEQENTEVLSQFDQFVVPDNWIAQRQPDASHIKDLDNAEIIRAWNLTEAESSPAVDELEKVIENNRDIFDHLQVEYHRDNLGYDNHAVAAKAVVNGREYAVFLLSWHKPEGVSVHLVLQDYGQAHKDGAFDNYHKIELD